MAVNLAGVGAVSTGHRILNESRRITYVDCSRVLPLQRLMAASQMALAGMLFNHSITRSKACIRTVLINKQLTSSALRYGTYTKVHTVYSQVELEGTQRVHISAKDHVLGLGLARSLSDVCHF